VADLTGCWEADSGKILSAVSFGREDGKNSNKLMQKDCLPSYFLTGKNNATNSEVTGHIITAP
jgi:hypothetical protein